jgi:hypothetical protein
MIRTDKAEIIETDSMDVLSSCNKTHPLKNDDLLGGSISSSSSINSLNSNNETEKGFGALSTTSGYSSFALSRESSTLPFENYLSQVGLSMIGMYTYLSKHSILGFVDDEIFNSDFMLMGDERPEEIQPGKNFTYTSDEFLQDNRAKLNLDDPCKTLYQNRVFE